MESLDTRSFKVVRSIPTGLFPCDLDRTADGQFAYVAAMSANAVAVINTATRKVVKMIPAGREPWGLLVFPAP